MKKILSIIIFVIMIVLPCYGDDNSIVTSQAYVTSVLNTKQNIIDKGNATGNNVLTYTNAAGGISPLQVKESLGSSTSDNTIPTVGAVNSGLNNKQDIIPAVDSNTVVTYGGVYGAVGEKGIYQDTGSYASHMDELIDAGTFNAALKNGLDNEFVCAGTDPSNGRCWSWEIKNTGTNSTNLYDPITNPIEQGTIASATGQSANYTVRARTSGYIDVLPNTQYTVSESGFAYLYVYQYDQNEDYLHTPSGWKTSPYTFRTDATAGKIRLVFTDDFTTNSTVADPANLLWLQVEPGANATPHTYTNLVPEGYTPLEYIKTRSYGGQYINTGITANPTIKVDTAVSFGLSTDVRVLVGTRNGSNVEDTNIFQWGVASGKTFNRYGMGYLAATAISDNTLYDVHLENGLQTVTSGGNNVASTTFEYNPDMNTTGTLYLFCTDDIINPSNTAKYCTYDTYVKYMRISKNGQIVRNFIPARRNNDNVVGMYDTVSNTFFTNSGSDSFIAGPDASNNVYIPQNQ